MDDDEDMEHMTRTEIITGMNLYILHAKIDNFGTSTQRNMHLLAEKCIVEGAKDGKDIHGMFGTATNVLGPKYRVLDMLNPHGKQNRLSYLVELLFDKHSKGI